MGNKRAIIGTNIKTGEEVEFESAHEAYRKLSAKGKPISRANIVFCLKGKRVLKGRAKKNPTLILQSGGYSWRYK